MQHHEGYELVNGKLQIAHFWQFVLSPWAIWAFLHNMSGAVIIGQPDVAGQRLENPIVVPGLLSFLAYGSFGSTVQGLTDFPRDERAAPLRRAHGSRTARRARGHRPRLGRQRGVAHRRRLHALRSARPRLCGRRSTASCSPGRGRGRSRSSHWPA